MRRFLVGLLFLAILVHGEALSVGDNIAVVRRSRESFELMKAGSQLAAEAKNSATAVAIAAQLVVPILELTEAGITITAAAGVAGAVALHVALGPFAIPIALTLFLAGRAIKKTVKELQQLTQLAGRQLVQGGVLMVQLLKQRTDLAENEKEYEKAKNMVNEFCTKFPKDANCAPYQTKIQEWAAKIASSKANLKSAEGSIKDGMDTLTDAIKTYGYEPKKWQEVLVKVTEGIAAVGGVAGGAAGLSMAVPDLAKNIAEAIDKSGVENIGEMATAAGEYATSIKNAATGVVESAETMKEIKEAASKKIESVKTSFSAFKSWAAEKWKSVTDWFKSKFKFRAHSHVEREVRRILYEEEDEM